MNVIDYQDAVLDVSLAADQLDAVTRLLDEYYFSQQFDAGDPVSKRWWISSYNNIQNVVGLMANTAASVKKRLEELTQVHLEDGRDGEA